MADMTVQEIRVKFADEDRSLLLRVLDELQHICEALNGVPEGDREETSEKGK